MTTALGRTSAAIIMLLAVVLRYCHFSYSEYEALNPVTL